jgi:site-specific recombinase XerD
MLEFEKKLEEEAQLRALSKRSHKTYYYRLKRLYDYYQKPLSQISLKELRDYFLYLINVKKLGRESLRNTRFSIRFYYVNCLGMPGHLFNFVRIKCKRKIPDIITRDEVRKIISHVKIYDYKICLELIYACGFRIGEVINLKIKDIDGERKMITVRDGKGSKDRTVPLPDNMLFKLREYWQTHLNKELLFPKRSSKRNKIDRTITSETISRRTIQSAMKSAVLESGINKKATPHTLRHCFATHLLEAGANIKAISKYLGHKSLRPTMIYLHLTNDSEEHSYKILNKIMGDL